MVSVVSVVSFRSFRWFRFGRFARFVSLFRVLVHALHFQLFSTVTRLALNIFDILGVRKL